MKKIVLLAVLAMAGCDDIGVRVASESPQKCFSIVTSHNSAPFAHVMLDSCTGKSWLLVRSTFGDKPEDGFTYKWLALAKDDYRNPVLVRNE